jgi:hypothetical protein
VIKLFVAVAMQKLDHMRPNVNATLAATFTANFGQGDSAVAFGDALIVVH